MFRGLELKVFGCCWGSGLGFGASGLEYGVRGLGLWGLGFWGVGTQESSLGPPEHSLREPLCPGLRLKLWVLRDEKTSSAEFNLSVSIGNPPFLRFWKPLCPLEASNLPQITVFPAFCPLSYPRSFCFEILLSFFSHP